MSDDDIAKRLREATDACLKAYEEWSGDRKKGEVREALMESVHELRKVAARLEIEIAISERDQMASKPIPIPPHRSKKRSQENNNGGGGNGGPEIEQKKPRRQKTGSGKNNDG